MTQEQIAQDREDLITDYIMIAGYTEEEATIAANILINNNL